MPHPRPALLGEGAAGEWLGCSWSSGRPFMEFPPNFPHNRFPLPASLHLPPAISLRHLSICPSVRLSVVKNLRSAFRWSEFASWLPILGEL